MFPPVRDPCLDVKGWTRADERMKKTFEVKCVRVGG